MRFASVYVAHLGVLVGLKARVPDLVGHQFVPVLAAQLHNGEHMRTILWRTNGEKHALPLCGARRAALRPNAEKSERRARDAEAGKRPD